MRYDEWFALENWQADLKYHLTFTCAVNWLLVLIFYLYIFGLPDSNNTIMVFHYISLMLINYAGFYFSNVAKVEKLILQDMFKYIVICSARTPVDCAVSKILYCIFIYI